MPEPPRVPRPRPRPGSNSSGKAARPPTRLLGPRQVLYQGKHRDPTYAAAFNTSADDLNVYWELINTLGRVQGVRVASRTSSFSFKGRTPDVRDVAGVVVGLVMGLVALPAVGLVMGSWPLAVTVALALLAACTVATGVAMALPWGMSALGRDPAFGSGPLATVLQDLLSLVLYFAIASAVLL